MKKFLVVICMCIASYSHAKNVQFGLKGGLNFINTVGADVGDPDTKAGLYLGGFLNAHITKGFFFQPEILYSTQGRFMEDKDNKIEASYLNIPLLLKMTLGGSDKAHLYAGPQLGFLLNAEQEVKQQKVTQITDITDSMNAVDFSLNLGFSFNVNYDLVIDLRYNRSLTKLFKDGSKAYNSLIQLGASYSF